MLIQVVNAAPAFTPVKLEITFESQAEVNSFQALVQQDISIPERLEYEVGTRRNISRKVLTKIFQTFNLALYPYCK